MFLRRAAPALARRTIARPVTFRSFAVSARQCMTFLTNPNSADEQWEKKNIG
jgi:hypothetical protein